MTVNVDPITVEVTRGEVVESIHRGSAVIVDHTGSVVEAWGDGNQTVYPRSAVKPLQALVLLETGAAQAFELGEKEIALACASHNGEERHVSAVKAWLEKAGISAEAFACGPQWPLREDDLAVYAAKGGKKLPIVNNCSGKHAGFLTAAKHMDAPLAGYEKPTHPVQQRVMGALEQIAGVDLGKVKPGTDGCSVPTWPMPLSNLAFAFARMATPDALPDMRQEAIKKVTAAMWAEPFMVGGTERLCTDVMEHKGGDVFLKIGAEGVFCAGFPNLGLGLALKCDDGARRAGEVMMASLLNHLGLLSSADDMKTLGHWMTRPVKNRRGVVVGEMRPARDWLG